MKNPPPTPKHNKRARQSSDFQKFAQQPLFEGSADNDISNTNIKLNFSRLKTNIGSSTSSYSYDKPNHNEANRSNFLKRENISSLNNLINDSDDDFIEAESIFSNKNTSSENKQNELRIFLKPNHKFHDKSDSELGEFNKGFWCINEQGKKFLVKTPIVNNSINHQKIIKEYVGLKLLKQMLNIIGSETIVPEVDLELSNNKDNVSLYIHEIEKFQDYIALHQDMTNKGNIFSIDPQNLIEMFLLNPIFGEVDRGPNNGGKDISNEKAVIIDLDWAFKYQFKDINDFKLKMSAIFDDNYKDFFQHKLLPTYQSEFINNEPKLLAIQNNLDMLFDNIKSSLIKLSNASTKDLLKDATFEFEKRNYDIKEEASQELPTSITLSRILPNNDAFKSLYVLENVNFTTYDNVLEKFKSIVQNNLQVILEFVSKLKQIPSQEATPQDFDDISILTATDSISSNQENFSPSTDSHSSSPISSSESGNEDGGNITTYPNPILGSLNNAISSCVRSAYNSSSATYTAMQAPAQNVSHFQLSKSELIEGNAINNNIVLPNTFTSFLRNDENGINR